MAWRCGLLPLVPANTAAFSDARDSLVDLRTDVDVGIGILASLVFFEFTADYVYDDSKSEPQLAWFAAWSVMPRDGLADFKRRRLVSRVDVAFFPLGFVSLEACNDRPLLDLGDPRPRLSGGEFCLLLFFRIGFNFPHLSR